MPLADRGRLGNLAAAEVIGHIGPRPATLAPRPRRARPASRSERRRRQRGQAAGRGCLRLLVGQPLAIEGDEIDRIDQQRRKAAVAAGVGDDLAGKREEQARALDQGDRPDVLGGMLVSRKMPA